MISQNVLKFINDSDTFPAYSDHGGYPLYYILGDNEVVCADCLNDEDSFRTIDAPHWNVLMIGINWEDADIHCADCASRIESAIDSPSSKEGEVGREIKAYTAEELIG
jgi:hypothetical protein